MRKESQYDSIKKNEGYYRKQYIRKVESTDVIEDKK